MEGVFFSEPVGRRVTFVDPRRVGTVDLDVDEVRVLKQSGTGRLSVIVRTHMDYFTYARIREQEWFQMTRDSIDPDIESFQFWSHAPVEMDLRLDRLPEGLADAPAGDLAEKIAAGLTFAKGGGLADASGYRYLTVLQDLEGKGVRRGFSAVWARES